MRDLLVLAAVASLVTLGFRNSFIAFLSWSWTAVSALNTYVYGFMQAVGINQIFAMLTLAHVFLNAEYRKQFLSLNRTGKWMTLFVLQGLIAATFAYPGFVRNLSYATDLFKILAFCLVMPIFLTNRTRIHATLFVLALGMSFHGLLDGLKFLASGGSHLARGVPKFGDNNHFAVMAAMAVPLTYYLAQYSAYRLLRVCFAAIALFTILAVVATHSRGGLLCIAVLGFWLIKNSRYKFASMAIVMVGAMAVVVLAPASWSERMSTMKEASEDGSFMGRLMAWKRSSAMALEHPLVGAGLGAAAESSIYWKYANDPGFLGFLKTPPPDGIALVAHSIWFQVLGDMGFVGFFFFIGILANAMLTRGYIRKHIKASANGMAWAGDLADMLAVTLIAFMIGGSLVSIAYQEFTYIVVMLLEVIKQQVIRAGTPAAGARAGNGLKGAA